MKIYRVGGKVNNTFVVDMPRWNLNTRRHPERNRQADNEYQMTPYDFSLFPNLAVGERIEKDVLSTLQTTIDVVPTSKSGKRDLRSKLWDSMYFMWIISSSLKGLIEALDSTEHQYIPLTLTDSRNGSVISNDHWLFNNLNYVPFDEFFYLSQINEDNCKILSGNPSFGPLYIVDLAQQPPIRPSHFTDRAIVIAGWVHRQTYRVSGDLIFAREDFRDEFIKRKLTGLAFYEAPVT